MADGSSWLLGKGPAIKQKRTPPWWVGGRSDAKKVAVRGPNKYCLGIGQICEFSFRDTALVFLSSNSPLTWRRETPENKNAIYKKTGERGDHQSTGAAAFARKHLQSHYLSTYLH
jgi:hypothetical protein